MSIYITGDTHGTIDLNKLINLSYRDETLTKKDYVIIVGDVAILWSSFIPSRPNKISMRDKDLIDIYNSLPFTTLFIDGNHENHKALHKFPVSIWNGGKVHKITNSIIHLMRGQIFNINNYTFFTMGGADSVDKLTRIENESWWPEEMPNDLEYVEAMKNLNRVHYKVDYVLTHCCQNKYLQQLCTMHPSPDELTDFLSNIEDDYNLQFTHWYFGHHHKDIQLDEKHTCLYQNIVKIGG